MIKEEKRLRQREADKRYALKHPDRLKAKNKRRWKENKEKESARNRKYHLENLSKINERNRYNRHGVTKQWHEEQLAEQDNKCAICGDEFVKTPHIDHDHRCCKNLRSCDKCRRGLLCTDCNLGIDRLKDDITILQNAIEYLNKYNLRTGDESCKQPIKSATSAS